MKYAVRSNIKGITRKLIANLNSLPQSVNAIGAEIAESAAPEVLSILSFVPPRPRRKIEWTSEKQRRAYFATNGFGKGIPYQRTGQGARGWIVYSVSSGTGTFIILENRWNKAKYVYGQFNQIAPQQGFHAITGWQQIRNDREPIFRVMIASAIDVLLPNLKKKILQ